jgi:hypothetical protein
MRFVGIKMGRRQDERATKKHTRVTKVTKKSAYYLTGPISIRPVSQTFKNARYFLCGR